MKKILHSIKTLIIATVLILVGVNSNAQNMCAASNTIFPTAIQNVCIGSPATMLSTTITTNGNGNNGNITYTWYSNTINSNAGGTMVQTLSTNTGTTTNTFTPPASIAGTLWYYCTVTNDGGDCAGTIFNTVPVQVNVNTLPKIFNVSGGGARCSNGPGLSISLNGSETGVKYQLLKDGTLTTTTFTGTGNSIGFVTTTVGSFTMIANNATNGCSSNMTGNAIITLNATPTASYATTLVSCKGGDGTITVTGTGGTPAYLYNIDGGVFSSSNIFTGITAGNHSISIKDASACIVNVPGINVKNAPPLSASISIVDPGNCTGADGSITANRVGGIDDGITPVQYELGGDVTRPYQNNNVFGGLSKGNYTVTVKDSKGCTAVSSLVSLTQTAGTSPTIFNLTGGGAICSGGSGVSINLSGSETGVSYQLQNGGTPVGTPFQGTGNPIGFYGNAPGTFTMVATNTTAGCNSIMNGSVTVTVNPLPKVFNFTLNGVRCSNSTGITLNLSGSEVGVNYHFVKNGITNPSSFPGNGNPLSFLTQDTSGTSVTMLATNAASGCSSPMTGSVNTTNVSRNPPLTPSYTKYYASSCVGGDGTITITPGGGTPGYLYSVDGGPFRTNNFLSGLAAGDHNIVIKDANSCTFTYPAITILTAPIMKVMATIIPSGSCTGNDGSITGFYLGGDVDGITPLQYKLDGDVTRPFQVNNTFNGLSSGNYVVTIKDSKGCIAVGSNITLTQAAPLVFTPNGYNTNVSSCGNGNDGSTTIAISGGVPPYHYKLNGVDQEVTRLLSYTIGNLAPSIAYNVSVEDSKGCSISKMVTLDQVTTPTAIIAYSGKETCIGASDGFITASQTGGVPGYSYSKDGGATYQGSYSFTNLSPGSYNIVVKDSKGCLSIPVSVTIYPGTVSCRMGNASGNSHENRVGTSSENTNLNKSSINSSLNIQAYPNPFGSEFTLNVQGNNKDRVFITVTDILGRRLYQAEGSANQQYKLGNSLAHGIYIVQVMQGDSVQTIKIVKE